MEKETGVIATPVLHLMKKSIRRMYKLLIVFIVLFIISIIDSIYQRCRIIDLIEKNDCSYCTVENADKFKEG